VSPFHIVPTRLLDPKNGATRGFDIVRLAELAPSSEVLPKLEPHLAKSSKGRHFIYMHWMDPHAPYDLGGAGGSAWDGYLREVALVDTRLGELMEMLDRTGVADRTTIILTADHGEAFGEHDTWEHGKTVYEELVRVPLLIASPGKKPKTVDAPVSLVDVGATILDLFGQSVPGYFMGESLLPLAYGNAESVSHPIAAEAQHKLRAFYSTDGVKVVFDNGRKTTEVYRLSTDPLEANNLADAAEMQPHIQRARRYFEAHEAKKK
jgi:arylsulfatase A-like enzyme